MSQEEAYLILLNFHYYIWTFKNTALGCLIEHKCGLRTLRTVWLCIPPNIIIIIIIVNVSFILHIRNKMSFCWITFVFQCKETQMFSNLELLLIGISNRCTIVTCRCSVFTVVRDPRERTASRGKFKSTVLGRVL